MKRMKPNEYRLHAASTLQNLVSLWTARYGTWNRDKIVDEIERLLRRRRQGRKTGRKSVDPSTPDRPFVQVGKPL